jgi:hypothetical protein
VRYDPTAFGYVLSREHGSCPAGAEIRRRDRAVSAIFKVPCPECDQNLSVADRGLECPDCGRSYQFRMGHLLPMTERASETIAAPAAPARP